MLVALGPFLIFSDGNVLVTIYLDVSVDIAQKFSSVISKVLQKAVGLELIVVDSEKRNTLAFSIIL